MPEIYTQLHDLTPEQARQWLMHNDREAAKFWSLIPASQTIDAVKDMLDSFGYEGQLGPVRVLDIATAL